MKLEFKIINSSEKLYEVLELGGKHVNFDRLLVFGVYEDEENNFLDYPPFKKFDFVYERIKKLQFKAKKDKNILIEAPFFILIQGMGKKIKFNMDYVRLLLANACKTAKANKLIEVVVIFPEFNASYYIEKKLFYIGSSIIEGSELALYEFKKYLSKGKNDKNKVQNIKSIDVYFNGFKPNKSLNEAIEKGFYFGKITSNATNFARNMINEPGNVITPEYLALEAKKIAKENKLVCEVFDEKKIIEIGMNAFYGVAMGSKNPPRFIHLTYKSEKIKNKVNKTKKIAFIGKGITFDSGGLSLKPADYMTTMKSDKSGACSVLAIMKVIKELSFDIELHGIIAACENMPDGAAQRPDDIVKALNGKTIEIENTDAEGRLTLADALSYAGALGVDEIIDLATLTGACVVALGEYTSGVMGNNKNLINNVVDISEVAGERMWELPFDDNMKEKLLSPVADLKNVGNRYGGAITAGMFLEEFVPENIKWCHIDIAGPSFTKTGFSYNPKGATGVGVRTLLYYLKEYASKK
jgi:leucyl aminopeptidase